MTEIHLKEYKKRIDELEAELAESEAETAALRELNDDLCIENQALKGQLQRVLVDRRYEVA